MSSAVPQFSTRPFRLRPSGRPPNSPRVSGRAAGTLGGAAALVTVATGIATLWPSGHHAPHTRASAIRECISAHGLQQETGVIGAGAAGTRVFGTCDWPPTDYSQSDGYSEVVVREADGPGVDEASGTSAADRLFAPCGEIQAAYSFGKQGAFRRQSPITVLSGDIVTVDGLRWSGDQRKLPFYPERDESVVLHNFSNRMDYARCVG